MKKVLLLFADVGSGHRMAVQALSSAIAARPDANNYSVQAIDLFAELDIAPFNTSNASHELFTSNYTLEAMASFVWRLSNTYLGSKVFRAYVRTRLKKETRALLQEYNPDLVICAHPIVSLAIASVKEELGFKLTVAITDLVTMMRGWHHEAADILFAPSLAAEKTIRRRIGRSKTQIVSPFFPLRTNYMKVAEKADTVKILNFEESKPIVGITGGGVGSKVLTSVISELVKHNKYNMVVFTGNLRSLQESLTRKYKNRKDIRILGFVDNVYDYFHACDLMIAKPSATTVMELIAMRKPTVFTKYLMENDKGNVTILKNYPWFRYIGPNNTKLLQYLDEVQDYAEQNPGLTADPSYIKMVETIVDQSLALIA